MTGTVHEAGSRSSAPPATRALVEEEIRRIRRRAGRFAEQVADPASGKENRGSAGVGVLLVRAAPEWHGPPSFEIDGTQVTVRPCRTVLGVLEAVTDALSGTVIASADRNPAPAEADGYEGYLVVLTPCDEHDLGASLLARAIGHKVHAINRWDLVRAAFGAHRLDPRLRGKQYRWLVDALLEARPPGGWPKARGPVLDLGGTLAALTDARLGLGHAPDMASLLDWSRDEAAAARFAALRTEEQQGIADWLRATVGPAADVLFRLVQRGHGTDALPFGLIVGVVFGTGQSADVLQAQGRAKERFFGPGSPGEEAVRLFGEAAESVVLRWQEAEPDHARMVLDRAEEILAEMDCAGLAESSALLEQGFRARLAALGAEIGRVLPDPRPGDLEPVEDALVRLSDHRLGRVDHPPAVAARMAVRLLRWLGSDRAAASSSRPRAAETSSKTLAGLVDAYVQDGAWVDRARALIWARRHDLPAYEPLLEEVRTRRDRIDEAFARKLAAWSAVSGRTSELVLAENLQERIARPVAVKAAKAGAAPLIVVVDGMSAAVACDLAEAITRRRRWLEVVRGPGEGREGGLAVVPSVTTYSRASLLSGRLTRGGRPEEERGFAEFWGRSKAVLFEKSDVRAGIDDVLAALGQRSLVVGVVLNAVDDALDHGRENGRLDWSPSDIAGLEPLLDEAWRVGRPVILTSDHGHVLDRGEAARTERSEHARYRVGSPEDGEVELTGPRVLTPESRVVVPWNERIRYTARQDGYHGGVSPAEMVIPILVFVPSAEYLPDGWTVYDGPMQPEWWSAPPAGYSHPLAAPAQAVSSRAVPEQPAEPARRPAGKPGRSRRPSPPSEYEVPLFEPVEAAQPARAPEPSLGTRVVGSELYTSLAGRPDAQRARVTPEKVAWLIDAAAAGGGRLPLQAAADGVELPVARMRGYVSTVSRLLNVDGYQVLRLADGGRTVELDVVLLREQFLPGE